MHRQAGREIAELGIDVLWECAGWPRKLFRGLWKRELQKLHSSKVQTMRQPRNWRGS